MQELETLKDHGRPSLSMGERIRVSIEDVFQNGIMVSYTDSSGKMYRGVLIRDSSLFQSRPLDHMSHIRTNYLLANPLTTSHDHPYNQALEDKQTKAKRASVWWTTQPRLPPLETIGQSIRPMITGTSSRTSSRVGRLSNMCCNNYFSTKTAVVELTRELPDKHIIFPSGLKRHAKLLAAIKINRSSTSSGRSLQQDTPSNSRSRTCAKNRRAQAPNYLVSQLTTVPSTTSPLCSSQLTTMTSHVHSHGVTNTLHLQLKDFSIHLERLPIKRGVSGSSRENAIVID